MDNLEVFSSQLLATVDVDKQVQMMQLLANHFWGGDKVLMDAGQFVAHLKFRLLDTFAAPERVLGID